MTTHCRTLDALALSHQRSGFGAAIDAAWGGGWGEASARPDYTIAEKASVSWPFSFPANGVARGRAGYFRQRRRAAPRLSSASPSMLMAPRSGTGSAQLTMTSL